MSNDDDVDDAMFAHHPHTHSFNTTWRGGEMDMNNNRTPSLRLSPGWLQCDTPLARGERKSKKEMLMFGKGKKVFLCPFVVKIAN